MDSWRTKGVWRSSGAVCMYKQSEKFSEVLKWQLNLTPKPKTMLVWRLQRWEAVSPVSIQPRLANYTHIAPFPMKPPGLGAPSLHIHRSNEVVGHMQHGEAADEVCHKMRTDPGVSSTVL